MALENSCQAVAIRVRYLQSMILMINPEILVTLNEAVNTERLDELVADMRTHGWRDRPLLVIETESDFVAWTGSHRIAAAIEAGLTKVPCYVLAQSKLSSAEFKIGCGHLSNAERAEIIRRSGDRRAFEIMEQER